jgi:hypothetical protein
MNKIKIYQMLILTELAISIVSSATYRTLYYRINQSLITIFENYREVGFDTRNFINSPVALIVSVSLMAYIYYGMMTFKKHARWLYILALPVSSAIMTYLAGTSLAHPLTVVLRNLEYLLYGAIIALSFSEPVRGKFETITTPNHLLGPRPSRAKKEP